MAKCAIDSVYPYNSKGDLEVIPKYEALMTASLEDSSLYTRMKETMFSQFEELQLSDKEKANVISQFMGQFSTQISQGAMQSAILWAKEERDGGYQLDLLRAQANNELYREQEIKANICIAEKEVELKCAQIEATLAASIRENGNVTTYVQDSNGDTCKPSTLDDAGLKYHQTKQVEADTYKIQADSYRKSGVVTIGKDPDDGVIKGLDGVAHTEDNNGVAGYTAQQTANAERQRIAYEDSKLNHAANSSSSMMGQMLSAEVAPADADVQRWRDAVDRLLTPHTSTDKK